MFCRADAVVCQSSALRIPRAPWPTLICGTQLVRDLPPTIPLIVGNNRRFCLFLSTSFSRKKLLPPLTRTPLPTAPSPFSSTPPPHATPAISPMFPSSPIHRTSTQQRTERVTTISLFSLAPLRLTHCRLLSPTPGLAPRFQTLASKEAAASTVSGPGGGVGSGLLSVLDQAITHEEQYCRERTQVQRKGMEAEGSAIEGISAGGHETCITVLSPYCGSVPTVIFRIHKLSSAHGTTIKFWDISCCLFLHGLCVLLDKKSIQAMTLHPKEFAPADNINNFSLPKGFMSSSAGSLLTRGGCE